MSHDDPKQLREIEVVADRTDETGPRDGFLRVTRFTLRNRYADGSVSETYSCDVVSRPGVDAVTVIVWDRTADGRVRVGLRENARPAIWLRPERSELLFPNDEPAPATVIETAAGILEPSDAEHPIAEACRRRAAAECEEEIGITVDPSTIVELGAPAHPSPGITDEKVFFVSVQADLDSARPPQGDGSVMEEVGGLVIVDLDEAIERVRNGPAGDMKTEIALLRLRDRLSHEHDRETT